MSEKETTEYSDYVYPIRKNFFECLTGKVIEESGVAEQ